MKILVMASTIDLKNKMGCTPAWWQLLKALYEEGNEVTVIPYMGIPVESLWWKTYDNPCARESIMYNNFLEMRKRGGKSPSGKSFISPVADLLIKHHVRPKWARHLRNVLSGEKFDLLFMMSIPLNHITGIPGSIRKEFGIPVVFYDGDMPTILPKYTISRGFKFNYYEGADLTEYDAFLTNSAGVIPDLEKMGARNVHALHYGIDPNLVTPAEVEKDIDIAFFGYGSDFREEWMEKLITIPSREMPDVNFAVAGGNFAIDLGRAKMIGDLSYSQWRQFSCRSRINLNITRWSHTSIFASSTSRPFELAAFGCCIVSQPYNGIEQWFDIGKEMYVVNSAEQAVETYRRLLADKDERERAGRSARARILKEHTFNHRAAQLIDIVKDLKQAQRSS